MAGQELAGGGCRDVGVMEAAEVILQRRDPLDERRHLRPQRFARELEAVAETLALDPEGVQRRHVGGADDPVVGDDPAVRCPDLRRCQVANALRLGRRHLARAAAGARQEGD